MPRKVGIVGAGRGGTAFLKALQGLSDFALVGVVDVRQDAPGMILAREMGIPTFTDLVTFLSAQAPDLIIEVTGSDEVRKSIRDHKQQGVVLVDAEVARLMMAIVNSKGQVITAIHEQARALASLAQNLNLTVQLLAQLAAQMAEGAQELADSGRKLSNQAGQARNHLSETGSVLSFIRSVADQTKLLGLNAAIEAARAGEHGRGFTVVANEVRKLADNSARSAEQISRILSDIEQSIENILRDFEATGAVTQSQASSAQEVAATVQELGKMAQELEILSQSLAELV